MTLTSLAQNVAAGLLIGFNIEHHIAPILASLQWLPVCFRIGFKILMITSVDIALSYIVQTLARYKPWNLQRSPSCSKVDAKFYMLAILCFLLCALTCR